MRKTAFIFPGQGAQKAGMGKDFYENSQTAREIYDRASERLGLDLKALCFEPNDFLDHTEHTQAAMTVTSIAMMEEVKALGLKADVAAGLSLGEYSALVCAGAMEAQDAVWAVRQRGILMEQAVPGGRGAMAAVLGLSAEKTEEVLAGLEQVQIANYNCPGQIVISGRKESVEQAGPLLKEAGARRVLPLNVSGPFHSVMLRGAGEKLGEVLEHISLSELEIPYASNVTGELVRDAGQIKELLIRQVYSSVRWQQCVEAMIRDGVELFVEIGPGKTLSGFVKKISRQTEAVNIETWEDLKKIETGGVIC